MKSYITFGTILIIFLSCSCKQSGEYKEVSGDASTNQKAIKKDNKEKDVEIKDRKLIKKGDIKFETSNVKNTKSYISDIVKEIGGYIAKDKIIDEKNRITHELVIRVPADKFDILLKKIAENTENIDKKEIKVKDVTEEYIDIESRIKTKDKKIINAS